MATTKAAFKVSACKRFAFIFNSLGEYFVVWSKEFARYMVESGIKHRVITKDDAEMLKSLIESSELTESDGSVHQAVRVALGNLNEAHSLILGYELDEEIISKAISFIEGAQTSN